MMRPPEPELYLRLNVTLTFNLLTLKFIVSCPCPVDHLYQLESKSVHSFSKYRVRKLGNRRTEGRADGRTLGAIYACRVTPTS